MKITRIHIENFGKLQNFTLDSDENIVSIYHENGWGKSTLADFIGAMLYGMPKKGNNKAYAAVRSKRKSWQGGVYGGSMDFTCNKGDFRVVRTFGDTPEGDTFQLIDLKSGTKSDKFTKNLGEELFGVGRETFDITAFFPQMNLLSPINDEARANLTGANKFEYDLQNLESAKKKIKEKIRDLKREITSKTEFEEILYKKDKLRSSLNALTEEKNVLEKQSGIDLTEIKNEINIEFERKAEIEGYNKKKNTLESEIISLQNQLTTPSIKPKINKGVIAGFSLVMLLLFGGIVTLGILNVFELAGCIAISLVLIIAYVVGMIFIVKRPVKTEFDVEKQNLLKLKQQEYQNFLQDRVYDEGKLQSLQIKYYTSDKEDSIKKEKIKNIEREYDLLFSQLETLQELFDRNTENTQTSKEKISILEKTLELMQLAQLNVSQRYIEPMQKSFDRYFKTLTDKNVNLNVNFEAVERTNLGDKEFEYLSQGYQDIVSICKRMALLDKIYENEKPVIVLDDPFVNLDDERLKEVKNIVIALSKQYQIFYLYCHNRSEIRQNS